MIVFDLECRPLGHRFEGWFASSDDYAAQQQRGLIGCPHCGTADVTKAVMAPSVGRKGNQLAQTTAVAAQPVLAGQLPPEAQELMAKLATLQAEALKQSRWVGKNFADESRKMHYGESEAETIHGQATPEQARDLLDEGIALMPLPFPVAPPDELN
ncbi:DUF1178 family protein [Novosphingobium sp.]|uniref:DUF1178 family protein n=1 Tax=Novosphingobium sp. TaxID=1874826 RepID=UPI0025EEFE26|nr:DUF1178 family protein [Novosphingobium sp.]MCC6925570.1 DUF1178 family protein [Novosphingobium sp.]